MEPRDPDAVPPRGEGRGRDMCFLLSILSTTSLGRLSVPGLTTDRERFLEVLEVQRVLTNGEDRTFPRPVDFPVVPGSTSGDTLPHGTKSEVTETGSRRTGPEGV